MVHASSTFFVRFSVCLAAHSRSRDRHRTSHFYGGGGGVNVAVDNARFREGKYTPPVVPKLNPLVCSLRRTSSYLSFRLHLAMRACNAPTVTWFR